ncbi:DUF5343 domain-containing protein [Suttonella sp. R2A3]|uniref:DUF5343 domain-containing protein n=1 Tax=Suttonella sp. R2A3 TaxID=2908648 RepID=UPI001F43EC6B|nr:DUF5343 domain-containing protein [Suttonella sp. R2A3]UJF23891.1 DUF5343 domain-containing protein [Suttonella sp. R2A3]
MANGNASFPKIAAASWWKLRDLFKQKVPAIVTPTYLVSTLSMSEASAKSNLIGPFKKIGIIDGDGKPTDRAYDWRDDQKYKAVCENLIEDYYPQEIKDIFHSPDTDLQQLTNWFMSHARCGEPAAKMYARFYILLLKADPSEAEEATGKKKTIKKASVKPKQKEVKTVKKLEAEVSESDPSIQTPVTPIPAHAAQPVQTVLNNAPELHINIQLHISPESSAEQIDKIFESMAKHLKDFNK